MDFADDIVHKSNNIKQAISLLNQVEWECLKIGQRMDAKMTKSMLFNAAIEVITMDDGNSVKQVLSSMI